jgi:glycosyltransferase involved in cell wall biosynthesis
VWVPGVAGRRFMRLMGVEPGRIHTGLLTGDGDVFYPPAGDAVRAGVVYAGQFIPRKRVTELWRAWRAVAQSDSLTMIGEGPLRDELIASGAPVEPELDAGKLAERFRQASALILVSAEDHWGLVVHEAALCGCLILITPTCGAAGDLVVHQKNGYVMSDCSEPELAKALAWLRDLTSSKQTEGRELSLSLAKQFSPGRWAERAVEIIQKQASERGSAAL